jgi:hypothetical protein
MCLLGLHGGFAAIQVRHECPITRVRQALRDAADLVVETPPLLDHDDARCRARPRWFDAPRFDPAGLAPRRFGPLRFDPRRFDQIALDGLTVGAME